MAPTIGLLQYKEIQIYNEEASFWIGFSFSEKILNFGNVSLSAVFRLLGTNFICTHLHDGVISVCMHALVGLENLRD